MTKEKEISKDKIYSLPFFKIVKYKNVFLAVAVDSARWIILKNEVQLEILQELIKKQPVKNILEKFENNQEDIVFILTQIEATDIENYHPKSNFKNTRLHLHLTNKCNMRCPHCYMKSGKEYEREMTTDEVKSLLKNFKEFGGTNVSLTGGEPTTRGDFFEIYDFISSLGMKTSIYTNGIFWDKERVKRLNPEFIEGIQISIDGYDEKSNSVVRGNGSFEKSLDTVGLFVKNGIYVKIAVTPPYDFVFDHKDDYIAFSKKLLEKYGRAKLEINYSYSLMQGRNLTSEKINEQKEKYFSTISEIVSGIYGKVAEDSFVLNISDCIFDSCGFGGLNVMANGDFYFCDRIPDVNKIENVLEFPFEKIAVLMKMAEKAAKIDNFKPCGDCELKYICGGGCRADYFNQFTKLKDFSSFDFSKISPRKCTQENREKFYNLMIKTYERFYR